ncbi:MAG: methyl-accepting chemotaxis protein [Chloroflexota bacterium]
MNQIESRVANMRTGTKFFSAFILVGIIILIGATTGFLSARYFRGEIKTIYTGFIEPSTRLSSIQNDVLRLHGTLHRLVLAPEKLSDYKIQIADSISAIDSSLSKLVVETGQASAAENDLDETLADFKQNWNEYSTTATEVMNALWQNQASVAHEIFNLELQIQYQNLVEKLDLIVRQMSQNASQIDAASQRTYTYLSIFQWVAGLFGLLLCLVLGYLLTRHLNDPLQKITAGMQNLQNGVLRWDLSAIEKTRILSREDELGIVARALNETEQYLQSMASVSRHIADGDLTVQFQPKSEQDVFGHSFAKMTHRLRETIHQISTSSQQVQRTSGHLSQSTQISREATQQVVGTIQKVAQSLVQQTNSLNQTSQAVDQSTRAAQQLVHQSGQQQHAILKTSQAAAQLKDSVERLVATIEKVNQHSSLANQSAREGADAIREAVSNLHAIQQHVNDLENKVKNVGAQSAEISSIIETIDEIATKTNILAINAAIEAAHAQTQSRKLSETILDRMMTAQCHLVNALLSAGWGEHPAQWQSVAAKTGLDMILATDADGAVVYSNDSSLLGWRFPDDPNAQAYPFRALIHRKDGIYCQESQKRSFDNLIFKFVGVSRADQPGIVQVGLNVSSLKTFELRISGFAVVADEIYQLAERAREATREIRRLIHAIQAAITDTVKTMTTSAREVTTSIARTDQTSAELDQIVTSVQGVYQQVQEAIDLSNQMERLSSELNHIVFDFNQILENNAGSTQQISAASDHVARSVEEIAAISEENSAAAEEVGAAADEVNQQTAAVHQLSQSLAQMSVGLQNIVSRFQV